MLYPGLEEYAVTELVTTMLRWSSAVFTLCGSANAPTASDASLHAQLRRIAEAVYKLARFTREDILSTTFEVLVVDSGAPFEPGKMLNKMREGEHDGDEHASQLATVGSVLDVGLVSLNGNGNGHGSRSRDDDYGLSGLGGCSCGLSGSLEFSGLAFLLLQGATSASNT